MAMIVVSDWVMCCMDCGGFHFLADTERVVTHPDGEMYTRVTGVYPNINIAPCPNIGKRFKFPDEEPVEGIEVQ